MTVATSSTNEFSIDRIVLHAFRHAGLWGIDQGADGLDWERKAVFGREVLEMLIKHLEAQGRLVRAQRFYDLTLVSGQEEYTLPEAIMDVYGDAALIQADQVGQDRSFETPVRQISRERWQGLGIRGDTGMPTLYYVERSLTTLSLRLWLTPDDTNAGQLRIQAYYLLANATGGGSTPDLERYWAIYLVDALAARLAEAAGLPGDKVSRHRQDAQASMQLAKQYSRQRTNNQAVVTHRRSFRSFR